jgi:hypothetical protein
MKYKVRTHELCWYEYCYIVEADSKEEVKDLIESGEGNIIYSDYDTTDQVDIESIEEI